MKYLLLPLLLLSLVACKDIKPVNDPVPASVPSGYYNGELLVDGVRHGSIAVLEPKSDAVPGNHSITIYGPHEGDILVSSRKCGVEKPYHYTIGKPVTLKMSELVDTFKQNCFFTITVTPFYKDWAESQFPIHSHMVGLYLRVKPEDFKYELKTNRGKFVQLREVTEAGPLATDPEGPLLIVNSTPGVKFGAFNCATPTPLEIDVPASGLVELDVDKLHLLNKGCLVQFKDKAGGFSPFVINVFKHDYIPLPDPIIEVVKDKLKINGSEFVTLTDINGAEFYGGKAEIDFEEGATYVVRQYTVKGRNVVCEFKNKTKTCWR